MAAGSYLVARSYLLQVGVLNNNFYNMGQSVSPNSVSNGTTVSTYIVPGFVSYTPSNFTYESVFSYASEAVRGRLEAGVTDFGIGQFVCSEYNEVLNQLAGGATPNTSLATGSVITSPNSGQKNFPRLTLMFTAAAVPVSSANTYVNINVVNCTVRVARPGTNQTAGKNPNNLTYEVVVSAGSRIIVGSTFSTLALAVANNYDTEALITSPAPMVVTTYVDDGSTTTVTLPYTPYSTEHAGAVNIFTKNGADAHASVSGISGKTVTITPGSAGDIWEMGIPVAYSNITYS